MAQVIQLTESFAPNTRKNHTARGIATLLVWSKSSRSCPFAPWGTFLPSLDKGTSGFARSANHAFLLASLSVTLDGKRNVEALGGVSNAVSAACEPSLTV